MLSQVEILTIVKHAVYVVLMASMPMMGAALVIGVIVSIFQAATQIHEQTLTFVPKLIVIALLLLFLGSWMLTSMNEFFALIFDKIAGM